MKKLLFTVYVIALIALVPAVIVGYLHEDKKENTNKESLVGEGSEKHIDGSILQLVRTF